MICADDLYVSASDVVRMPTSATCTDVVALAVLFDRSGSSTGLETVASFVTTLLSPGLTLTTSVIVLVAEGASVP